MNFNLECIVCDIKQVISVMDMLNVEPDIKEQTMKEVLRYLSTESYKKVNPEILGNIWAIITKNTSNEDPYKSIKEKYTTLLYEHYSEFQDLIEHSGKGFFRAVELAILGNKIDFVAHADLNFKTVSIFFENNLNPHLAIDHRDQLHDKLNTSQKLLYIGDNCGEICLDKLLISYIIKEFPEINITYAVRGKAIVNDVTIEDASLCKMHEIAGVISNGDSSLGTVLSRTSDDFKKAFYYSDLIISKGQGNFESLFNVDKSNIFCLFLTKCNIIEKILSVEPRSLICAELEKIKCEYRVKADFFKKS